MPYHARSHQEFRETICARCFGKPKSVRLMKPDSLCLELVQNFVNKSFNLSNESFPQGICEPCRRLLLRQKKDPDYSVKAQQNDLSYENLKNLPPHTRANSGPCSCQLCEIGRKSGWQKSRNQMAENIPPKTCPQCFGVLARGVNHPCTKTDKRVNLAGILKSASRKTKGKVTSSAIKDICQTAGVSTQGGTINLPTGGKPLSVTVGRVVAKKRKYTTDNLLRLQASRNFSDNDMKAIASATRVVFGRDSVAKDLPTEMTDRNHYLDEHFRKVELDLKFKPAKKDIEDSDDDSEDEIGDKLVLDENGCVDIKRVGVFTTELDEFVAHLMRLRVLDPETTVVKIGLDDGQGIFKVCMSLQTLTPAQDQIKPKRAKYSDGVAAKDNLETSVKKLMIICAVAKVQELHQNLEKILNEQNLDAVDFSMTGDIKIVLACLGKDAASCKHSCPYCEGSSSAWHNVAPLNTVGSLGEWHQKWIDDGSNSKKGMQFQNMRHKTLVTGPLEQKIIEIFNPMELHLLLGVVDKLLTEIKRKVFEPRKGKKFVDDFLKAECISQSGKRGGKLQGNQCRKLLRRVDKLEGAFHLVGSEVVLLGLPYKQCLRDFDRVVHLCFGRTLLPGYKDAIAQFSASYRSLGISVTPKVHIVERHLLDFFDMKSNGLGLGWYSEQAFESVHADFSQAWSRVKVPMDHPEFGTRLLACISAYNAKHI